ncbi:MAG: glycosyltransferase family 1 protein [Candidatus Krumholzibacteriia bacterium]
MIINGRFLGQSVTGVQRFGHETLRAAVEHGILSSAQDRIFVPEGTLDGAAEYGGLPVHAIGAHQGHRWEQFDLARACGDEVLLNFCNTGPVWRRKQLVVLHDAAVAANPRNYTFAFRAWYQVMIRAYGRRAAKIGTVSKNSAGEISRYFGIPAGKIEVIPESGEHILRHAPDYSLHEEFGLEQDGYFLAVSSLAPNKNFLRVLEAVARLPDLPFKFVIVGKRNDRIFKAVSDLDVKGAIEAGFVTDAQIRALYERAACFVFPSIYEGFGLPPLEAMNCGSPVLASRSSSMPEVCGDAAAYCDPLDVDDIAKQLGAILQSTARREEMRASGRAHAAKWTWEKAARRLQEITDAI